MSSHLTPPNDVDKLCADLGIGLKRRAKLATEHGDGFVPFLQRLWIWAKRQDEPTYLHQHATASTQDYTDNSGRAMWGTEEGPEESALPRKVDKVKARAKTAERKREEHAEEQVVDQSRQLAKQIKDAGVAIVRAGGDPTVLLAGVQRMVSGERDRMRDAA